MTRTRAALLAVLLVVAALAWIPPARAAPDVDGCAKMEHQNTLNPTHRTSFRVSTDDLSGLATCTDKTFQLLEALCLTLNVRYRRDGATAPADPSVWEIYWYYSNTENDHGAGGGSNWNAYLKRWAWTSSPQNQVVEVCATTTGDQEGNAQAGNYRLVLRTCTTSGGATTCNAGATSPDINSDENPTSGSQGSPGTGQQVSANYGLFPSQENPNISDPLWIMTRPEVYLGASVNVTIKSEYDNGTARTGAAENITIFVIDSTGASVVTNQTVTETTYSGDRPAKGFYHYAFTPAQVGRYVVTVQSITTINETRTSKPWVFDVYTPPVGDLSITASYSWDTHHLGVTARVVDQNGTARAGLAAQVGIKIFAPTGGIAGTPTAIEGNLPGTYAASAHLGTAPELGTWLVYVDAPAQSDGGGNLTAAATVIVTENLTLKLADLRSLVESLASWMNASLGYTNSLINATSSYSNELTNATSTYSNELVNATRALDEVNFTAIDAAIAELAAQVVNVTNASAPAVEFTIMGDPAPDAGVYAGRAARFAANVSNTSAWGGLIHVWDFGDNTTASGPVAYHAYARPGAFVARLDVYNALGQSANASQNVTVNFSTPTAVITAPTTAIAFDNVTFRAGSSYDNHSDIVAFAWEVDPRELDLGWFGTRRVNRGGIGWDQLIKITTPADMTDLKLARHENFTFIFTTTGNHSIHLTAVNALGERNTTNVAILIEPPIEPATLPGVQPGAASQAGEAAKTRMNKLQQILSWIFGTD